MNKITTIAISFLFCSPKFAAAQPSAASNKTTILIKLRLSEEADIKVNKALLKYNKQLALSFTLDDGYRSAFLCSFPLLNGGKVSPPFVDGWGKDQGGDGSISKGLYYSDGCGNDVPFRLGLAVNASSFDDTRPERGNLNWEEIRTLTKARWDLLNHSYHHSTKRGTDYESEVTENNKAVAAGLGYNLAHFVVPGGEGDPGYDMEYAKAAFQNGLLSVATTSGAGPVIDVSKPVDLNKLVYNRTFIKSESDSDNFAMINRHLTQIESNIKRPGATWCNEFTHGVGNENLWGISLTFPDFKHYMTKLAANHGAAGDDKLWMAPWQEVYEYLWTRDHAVVGADRKGRDVMIKVTVDQPPTSFRHRSLSLVINTNAKFEVASQPAGVTITSNGKTGHNLINIKW